jgi:hypothetical protein
MPICLTCSRNRKLANGHLDKDIDALMPWAYAQAQNGITMSTSGTPL